MKTRRTGLAAGRFGWRVGLGAVVLALVCLWLPACGQREPAGQGGKFEKDVRRYIKQLSPVVAPLMKQPQKAKLDAALQGIYREAAKKGEPLPFALALLDKNGIYLTGRYQIRGKPEGEEDTPSGKQGYGSYQAVKDCLQKHKVTQVVLYWEKEKYFSVCAPLTEGGKTVGALILVYGEHLFSLYPGLTEKQFMELDLDE